MMNTFCTELEARKKLKLEFQNNEIEKNKLIRENDEKLEFLKDIPVNVKKIADACKPIQTIFRVSDSMNFEQVQV